MIDDDQYMHIVQFHVECKLPLSLIGQVYSEATTISDVRRAGEERKIIENAESGNSNGMGKMIDWLNDETTQAFSESRTQFTRTFAIR